MPRSECAAANAAQASANSGSIFTASWSSSIAEATELLQEAVKIEPEFADACAALAAAHSERGIWGRIGSRETAAKAREAITRALALDADSSEAYATLANINMVYD